MPPPNPAPDDAPPLDGQPFTDIITAEYSALGIDLNRKMSDLMTELRQEQANRGGKAKGSLTLTLDLKLDHRGAMTVGVKTNVKTPEPETVQLTMHLLKNNGLTLNNPKQLGLGLEPPRDMLAESVPMRIVNNER